MICAALFVFSLSGNCVVLRRICCHIIGPYIVRCIISSEVGAIWNRRREVYPWYWQSEIVGERFIRGIALALYIRGGVRVLRDYFCTCLCISKRMGCCLCMCLSLLLCGRLASRFRHCQLRLESRPSLHPPLFRAGGCALILYNFESKMQYIYTRKHTHTSFMKWRRQ